MSKKAKEAEAQAQFNEAAKSFQTTLVRPAIGTLQVQMTQVAVEQNIPHEVVSVSIIGGMAEAMAGRSLIDRSAPVKHWRRLAEMALARAFDEAERIQYVEAKAAREKAPVVPGTGIRLVPATAVTESVDLPVEPEQKPDGAA